MESALAWLDPPSLIPVVELPAGPCRETGAPHRTVSVNLGDPGTRYDGMLARTPAEHLVAVDLLTDPDARAATLGAVVPRGAAIARQAAVWVHTGRLCPARVAVVVPPERRVRTRATVHRQRLADGDVVQLGGVPTTSPVRTAVDLLCFATPPLAVAGIQAMFGVGLSAASVRGALARAVGHPTRRAEALLSAADIP